jgi:hypothetical protein
MGITDWLKRNIPTGLVKDKVLFHDTLNFVMRDINGKVVKYWKEKHNTWTATGLDNIRNSLCDGGYTKITYMVCNGTGGTEVATTNTHLVAAQAVFVATWVAAGAITGITTFNLRQTTGGVSQSLVTVTSFDKPNGISLEVTWTTTLS